MKIVFLLEERSMKITLEGVLPRLIPGVDFQCIPHAGKQDLEASIPRKLHAWREPGIRFVIVHDQDSSDCKKLKKKLIELCKEGGRADSVVRIICHELEAWFLGDLIAVEKAFGKKGLSKNRKRKRFRNPDSLANPFQELKKMIPEYQKLSGARKIAPLLDLETPGAHSLAVFLNKIREIVISNPRQ